jgi:hypothetical protein
MVDGMRKNAASVRNALILAATLAGLVVVTAFLAWQLAG